MNRRDATSLTRCQVLNVLIACAVVACAGCLCCGCLCWLPVLWLPVLVACVSCLCWYCPVYCAGWLLGWCFLGRWLLCDPCEDCWWWNVQISVDDLKLWDWFTLPDNLGLVRVGRQQSISCTVYFRCLLVICFTIVHRGLTLFWRNVSTITGHLPVTGRHTGDIRHLSRGFCWSLDEGVAQYVESVEAGGVEDEGTWMLEAGWMGKL